MKTTSTPDGRATVHFKSSEDMSEVPDRSVRLLVGASVYLGKGAAWSDYADLYERVYRCEGERVLSNDSLFVLLQTDAYENGGTTPRNALLIHEMVTAWGWDVLDVKIWKRMKSSFFQPPFSQVTILRPPESTTKKPKGTAAYRDGIWDYPQTADANNSYPAGLCELLVESLTAPGDLICDPFAGSARLLAVAARLERRAIGYEIDETLYDAVNGILRPPGLY